jgi:hypothetical protein
MKIRTAEQLSDVLSEDLSWRKKELSVIKSLITSNNFSEHQHRVLIRNGICILYSHWEGFIKFASNAYVEYVGHQKLCYKELSPNFLALAMKQKLSEAQETSKASIYTSVCKFFLSDLHQRASIPKDIVYTSNLSSDVLKEIMALLGLDVSDYATKFNLIDVKLLKKRNNIAHGKFETCDKESYVELHQEVVNMIDLFRNKIENAVACRDYMNRENF